MEEIENMEKAEWTTAFMNDLPDSSFAYIRPGGHKDEEGKTVPRNLRYLPFKDSSGEIDLPHLRNALARLPQTELSAEEKNKARNKLMAAARTAGVGEYRKEDDMLETKIEENAEEKIEVKPEARPEDIAKLEEVQKELESKAEIEKKQREEIDKAYAEIEILKRDARRVKFADISKNWYGEVEDNIEWLEKLSAKLDDDELQHIIDRENMYNSQIKEGQLFKEIGVTHPQVGTSEEKLLALIESRKSELRKSGKGLTDLEIIDMVLSENPDLYNEQIKESNQIRS
jgi:hypothetical protein